MERQPAVESSATAVRSQAAWITAMAVLAAALVVAVAAASSYRGEAAHARQELASVDASVTAKVPLLLRLSSSTAALPSSRLLAGEVTVFAVHSSAGLARIMVTAQIRGGRPHARYELSGGDCAGNGPDHDWAAGVTDAAGSAEMTGPAWTVSVSHEYFLALNGPGRQDPPGPALRGHFGRVGGLSAVVGGVAPCAP
jgi:hypothetical protein